MLSQKKEMRAASGFLLIIAFLLLSHCPLRRTIQNLIKGTNETGCRGILNSSNNKLNLPVPTFEIRTPAFTATVLKFYYPIRSLTTSEGDSASDRRQRGGYLNSIALFLKNRILLI